MNLPLGNAAAHAEFAAAMAGGVLPHAWLFAGPEGVGKARFARIAALRLLAEAAEPDALRGEWGVDPAAQSIRLFASGTHPDYLELARLPGNYDPAKIPPAVLIRIAPPERRAAFAELFPGLNPVGEPDGKEDPLRRSIVVAQVRGLIAATAAVPALSSRRMILIDSIDDLERSAANALLKVLEEPPAGTIFLLISHAPGRLLPTIRSRCRLLRFEALAPAELEQVVRAARPETGADELAALLAAGQGSPGRALRLAGLDLVAMETEMTAIATTGDADNAIRFRLARALGTKAAQARYEAFLERAPGFVAERARSAEGDALPVALDAYGAARELATAALGLSLDPGATVVEMCGLIARLAPR